jgi:hypothetical protein
VSAFRQWVDKILGRQPAAPAAATETDVRYPGAFRGPAADETDARLGFQNTALDESFSQRPPHHEAG